MKDISYVLIEQNPIPPSQASNSFPLITQCSGHLANKDRKTLKINHGHAFRKLERTIHHLIEMFKTLMTIFSTCNIFKDSSPDLQPVVKVIF